MIKKIMHNLKALFMGMLATGMVLSMVADVVGAVPVVFAAEQDLGDNKLPFQVISTGSWAGKMWSTREAPAVRPEGMGNLHWYWEITEGPYKGKGGTALCNSPGKKATTNPIPCTITVSGSPPRYHVSVTPNDSSYQAAYTYYNADGSDSTEDVPPPPPPTGSLHVRKSSKLPQISEGNSRYGTSAKFSINTLSGTISGTSTNGGGNSWSKVEANDVLSGSATVTETQAPTGFTQISGNISTSVPEYSTKEITVSNEPYRQPIKVLLAKADKELSTQVADVRGETPNKPQGDGVFHSAQFRVTLYDKGSVTDGKPNVSDADRFLSFTIKTVQTESYPNGVVDFSNATCRGTVADWYCKNGSNFNQFMNLDGSGVFSFPLGVLVVEEIAPPEGYLMGEDNTEWSLDGVSVKGNTFAIDINQANAKGWQVGDEYGIQEANRMSYSVYDSETGKEIDITPFVGNDYVVQSFDISGSITTGYRVTSTDIVYARDIKDADGNMLHAKGDPATDQSYNSGILTVDDYENLAFTVEDAGKLADGENVTDKVNLLEGQAALFTRDGYGLKQAWSFNPQQVMPLAFREYVYEHGYSEPMYGFSDDVRDEILDMIKGFDKTDYLDDEGFDTTLRMVAVPDENNVTTNYFIAYSHSGEIRTVGITDKQYYMYKTDYANQVDTLTALRAKSTAKKVTNDSYKSDVEKTGLGWMVYTPDSDQVIVTASANTSDVILAKDVRYLLYWGVQSGASADDEAITSWQICSRELSDEEFSLMEAESAMVYGRKGTQKIGTRNLIPTVGGPNDAAATTGDQIRVWTKQSSLVPGTSDTYSGISLTNYCISVYPKSVICYEQVIRGGVEIEKWDLEYNASVANGASDNSNISKDSTYTGTHLDGISFNINNISERYIIYHGKVIKPNELVTTISTKWDPDKNAYIARTEADDLPYGTYSIRESARDIRGTYNATDTNARIFQITRDGEMVNSGFVVDNGVTDAHALGANHDKGGTDTKTPLVTKNFVTRSDFKFVKTGDDDFSRISTLWIITNQATGERHVIYTDEAGNYQSNGEFDGSGNYIDGGFPDHNRNTNALDVMLAKIDAGEQITMKPESLGGDLPDHFWNINPDTGEFSLNKYELGGLWFSKSEMTPAGDYLYTHFNGTGIETKRYPEGDVPVGEITGIPNKFGWSSSMNKGANASLAASSIDALTLNNAVALTPNYNTWTDAGTVETTEHYFGALPKGTYILQEVATDTNFVYDMRNFTFNTTRQNQVLDVGTVDDAATPVEPLIHTTATNGDTQAHLDYAGGISTIVDTVYYEGLKKLEEYKLSGYLWDATTNTVVFDSVTSLPVRADKTFTTDRFDNGNEKLEFSFTSNNIAGHKIVVFEELYYRGNIVAEHTDPDDVSQTIYYPSMDSLASAEVVDSKADITVSDNVSYDNLDPNATYYLVTGLVKEDGTALTTEDLDMMRETSAVRGLSSAELEVSEEAPVVLRSEVDEPSYVSDYVYYVSVKDLDTDTVIKKEQQTVPKNFGKDVTKQVTVDTTSSIGHTLSFEEHIYPKDPANAFVVDYHDGLTDLTVNGNISPSTGSSIGLIDGETYNMEYRLSIPDTNEAVTSGTFVVTISGSTTPYTITMPNIPLKKAEYLLEVSTTDHGFTGLVQKLIYSYEDVVKHTARTVKVGKTGGLYNSSGIPYVERSATERILDRVLVTDLTEGDTVTLLGVLRDNLGEEYISEVEFEATAPSMYVDIYFDRVNTMFSNTLIAAETIMSGSGTVYTEDKEITVGVIPGNVFVKKTYITGSEAGSTDVDFTLDFEGVNDQSFVFVNRMYAMSGADTVLTSLHDSVKNTNETFTVSNIGGSVPTPPSPPSPPGNPPSDTPPETPPGTPTPSKYFRTTATGQNGTKTIPQGSTKVTITDKVEYKGYGTGGTEYIMKGVLYNKKNGQPYTDANGKNVIVEQKFKPTSDSGIVTMTFTFNGSNLMAGDSLVVYEYMYSADGKTLIAQHTDINDAGQTVTVVAGLKLPQTGLQWWIVYLLATLGLILIGGAYVLYKNNIAIKNVNAGYIAFGVGILGLCIAVGLVFNDKAVADNAGDFAADTMDKLEASIIPEGGQNYATVYVDEDEAGAIPVDPDADLPEVEIDGVNFIGKLTIPSVDMILPIASTWSYPQLKKTPCRYAGTTYADNMVLFAHNYKKHFAPIKTLKEGDKLSFTDANGIVTYYQVKTTEVLNAYAVDEMTTGDWDLTLFTCTDGGSARTTVRCVRI